MSLYIIHLSDIHIKGNTDLIMSRVESIKRTCAGSILDNSDVILAISGDIAFSGSPHQYETAAAIIDEVSSYLSTERNARIQYAFVPGNHDCDFGTSTQVRDILLQNIQPSIDKNVFDTVSSVQNNYIKFAEQYDSSISGMISTKEITLISGKVLFLLINTAWMSTLKETPGRIILPSFSAPSLNTDKYQMVFSIFHHPENWFNPDYKQDFVSFIRKNSDFALVGHEHIKDSYQKIGNQFSLAYDHGKELQDSESDSSGFSIIEFNDSYDEYCTYDFNWNGTDYSRSGGDIQEFKANRLVCDIAFRPNKKEMEYIDDLGVGLHHFAKDPLNLSDLFIWPELRKVTLRIDKKVSKRIKTDILSELSKDTSSIIVGPESCGKTVIAKMLYHRYASDDLCCLLINGQDFTSTDPKKIISVFEKRFSEQYQADAIDEYRRLSKKEKILIIDDFDGNKFRGEMQNELFDILVRNFGKIYIFASSEIEVFTLMKSSTINDKNNYSYYEILPLGNKKRKELIEKWYRLNTKQYDNSDITARIETSIQRVNTFLGNGSGFVPAYPISVLSVLAYSDSINPTYNGSQYGFLYETMIQKSLSGISAEYNESGAYNIDVSIVSQLAFNILKSQDTSFSTKVLNSVVEAFNKGKIENVSSSDLINRMCNAKLFYHDSSEGDVYCFKYPYIFYYFAGRYMAYHMQDPDVVNMVNYMSERLYIETYGNIMIFVCHFANNSDIIDTILINAYSTLEKYETFNFSMTSSITPELAVLAESIMPKIISNKDDVVRNKETKLERLDDAGIIDGTVHEEKIIDDTVPESEQDAVSISASFKTLEVLGQILQNYPGDISGSKKIEMISEMHQMSMRTVQAMITALKQIEDDFAAFIVSRSIEKGSSKTDTENNAHKFIRFIIAQLARIMISQVAVALNSKFLLPAAEASLMKDGSISARLLLTELKVNQINSFSLKDDIEKFRKELEENKEQFALYVLASIMSTYLNYNECDYNMRKKICNAFGFSEKATLTRLLEEKI